MSFMSEPQSREVLVGHSDRLLTEFDTQLRIIADRYLAFFKQRSVTDNVVRLIYFTLIIRLLGEPLRQPSQFSECNEPATYLTVFSI